MDCLNRIQAANGSAEVLRFLEEVDASLRTEGDPERRKSFVTALNLCLDFYDMMLDQTGTIIYVSSGLPAMDELKMDAQTGTSEIIDHSTVFVVHGHDNEAKETVARFIEQCGLKAVILHEQPNRGRTIIEKFEDYSKVAFAVVLLTPDDVGAAKDHREDLKPRARQNVIFELGFFIGLLGRERVCALSKGGIEPPSDFQGILWINLKAGDGWKIELVKELKAADVPASPNW